MSALVNRCRGSIPLMDSALFLSLAPCLDVYTPPLKKHRLNPPLLPRGASKRVASIDTLPDECLFEILRRLSGKKDRSTAACVSRRWLMLLSSIRSRDIAEQKHLEFPKPAKIPLPDLNLDPVVDVNYEIESYPDIICCLEGKDATDARLAAVAIRDSSGLGKLSIRSCSTACSVTDLGLRAVARCCSALRTIMLWDVPDVGDDGLAEIAQGCPMLEKLDLCQCPSITDAGIAAIAENCPNLLVLNLESCMKIGDKGLQAVAQFCPKLQSLSVSNGPLVGDEGVCSIITYTSSTLKKVKLRSLAITDVSLGVIGYYGREITDLVLDDLPKVAERGFWVMGNTYRLQKLATFKVTCCAGLTDLGLEAVAKGCPLLKHLCVRKNGSFSDAGLKSLARAARSIESVLLEDCSLITLPGLITALQNCSQNLIAVSIIQCMSVGDAPVALPSPLATCSTVRFLTIRNCKNFGNNSLDMISKIFPKLQSIDMRSLTAITDSGLLKLIENCGSGLVKVNLSNCVNITDVAVSVLARLHGATLETLALEGCRKISDASLQDLSSCCSSLANLDVSFSSVTDAGIAALASTHKLNLKVLSLAHCSNVTVKSLALLGNMGRSLMGVNLQNCRLISSSSIGSLQEKMWWCDILF